MPLLPKSDVQEWNTPKSLMPFILIPHVCIKPERHNSLEKLPHTTSAQSLASKTPPSSEYQNVCEEIKMAIHQLGTLKRMFLLSGETNEPAQVLCSYKWHCTPLSRFWKESARLSETSETIILLLLKARQLHA